MRVTLSLMVLIASSSAWGEGFTVTAGVGGGVYAFRTRSWEPRMIVPFREIGGEVLARHDARLTLGLQMSVRQDVTPHPVTVAAVGVGLTPGASGGDIPWWENEPRIAGGTRWRVAPYVLYRVQGFRARVGLVAGTYYDPTEDEAAWIYPQASVGLGNDQFHIEVGLLDAPSLASSANGGLGVVAMRMGMLVSEGHRMLFGVGGPYGGPGAKYDSLGGLTEDTYFSYAYEGELGRHFAISLGGYLASEARGAFVALTRR